jgi:hypothetical protein
VLRQNGTYLCVTPSRLNGPHDISKYFDDEATGLHIKEYTNAELQALFLAAEFFRLLRLCGRRGPVSEIARVAACRDRDAPATAPHLDKKIHRETPALHRPPRGSDGRTRLNQNGRAALSRNPTFRPRGSGPGREAHGLARRWELRCMAGQRSGAGISRPEGGMGDA